MGTTIPSGFVEIRRGVYERVDLNPDSKKRWMEVGWANQGIHLQTNCWQQHRFLDWQAGMGHQKSKAEARIRLRPRNIKDNACLIASDTLKCKAQKMKCFSFEHKCKQCGKEFNGIKTRTYCCTKCAYNDKERLKELNKKDRGNGTCKWCGKVFPITTISPRGIFCSRNCSGTYTGNKILAKWPKPAIPKTKLNCEYCHKEFGVIPSMANKRRFCSISCATLGSTKKRTMTIRMRRSHYGGYSRCKNGWHQIGGQEIFARSLWESNYAYYLEWLRANGSIQSWEHEPETFWFDGIRRGVCSYLPDFKVIENNGDVVYHEVKGWMDKKSITKLKRMKKYHPTVKMFLADSKWFAQNANKLSGLVNGWGTEPIKRVKNISASKLTKKKLANRKKRL